MTDSPIQDAITHLRAVIKDTQDEGKEPHIGVFKAMHALSYVVKAAENLPPASVRESVDSTPSAPASAAMRHSAGAEPLRETVETGYCIDDYHRGYRDGWETAHAPAACGHARANWKDPKFGTPKYNGEEKCEICESILALAPPAVDRSAPITWQIAQIIRETIFVDKAGVVCDIEHCSAKIATAVDRAAVIEAAAAPFLDYLAQLREHFQDSTPETIIVGGPYNLTYAHFEELARALADAKEDGK